MNKKPEPLFIDGERFEVQEMDEDLEEIYGTKGMIRGAGMNLSPYEAQHLRDWLNKFLKWYYKED